MQDLTSLSTNVAQLIVDPAVSQIDTLIERVQDEIVLPSPTDEPTQPSVGFTTFNIAFFIKTFLFQLINENR